VIAASTGSTLISRRAATPVDAEAHEGRQGA
jgi:hypothetical protein